MDVGQHNLIREIAVLGNKIENLAILSEKIAKDVKSKDERLDVLEKSRIQMMTILSTAIFILGTCGGFAIWTVDRHIDTKFDEKIKSADLKYLLCTKYRSGKQISMSDLPKICQ